LVRQVKADRGDKVVSPVGEDAAAPRPRDVEAARKRAAVELFARHEQTLRRTAGRVSMCADDVDDALQRALEILLTKAPSDDQRELIRWMQTVVKHEALAVRAERERILAGPAARPAPQFGEDWVAMLPSHSAGPAERAERSEAIARSREALQALKPQELRALSLIAEGYSYAEIGEITGYSATKINRCLAEGRERFRKIVARSEDGRRCADLGPLLSAFCDGEAPEEEVATLREHLRACSSCRATVRAYRAAPAAVAGLLPALPVGRSFFERAHQALADLASRIGLGAGEQTASQVAIAGGTRGAGAAALAKVLAVCAGAAGGAACVATGVAPLPLAAEREERAPAIERRLDRTEVVAWHAEESEPEPTPQPTAEPGGEEAAAETAPATAEPEPQPEPEPAPPAAAVPAPAPAPAPVAAAPIEAGAPPAAASAGSAAGEFGP
jgi:RNA polymerase sigma factor (sigma-70 family)